MKKIFFILISFTILGGVFCADLFAGKDEALNYLSRQMDKYFTQDKPRLIESYANPYPAGISIGTAFIYDNSLVVCAFLSEAKKIAGFDNYAQRAKSIIKGFILLQEKSWDGDGRLYNGYYADTDLEREWRPRASFSGANTGNNAWAMIALAQYYKYSEDPDTVFLEKVKQAALKIGNFIETEAREKECCFAGYNYGIPDPFQPAILRGLKSTEHNIDVYAAFMQLYELIQDQAWQERAKIARDFTKSMESVDYPLLVGTVMERGFEVENFYNIALDPLPFYLLSIGSNAQFGDCTRWNDCYIVDGLNWAEKDLRIEDAGFKGFAFGFVKDRKPQGIWWEGTAQMICAYRLAETYGYPSRADLYQAEIDRAQRGDGALLATPSARADTGFGWYYYPSPHIAATSWYIFTKNNYNPFWGTGLDEGVPYDGSFPEFIPGDIDGSGNLTIGDAIYLLNYMFIPGSPAPQPLKLANVNGDTQLDLADVVYLLNYLFAGGPAPK